MYLEAVEGLLFCLKQAGFCGTKRNILIGVFVPKKGNKVRIGGNKKGVDD